MAEKNPLSERPRWKFFVQIMTIIAGVSAAMLAGIAVWIGITQLHEMQRRPFLSLAFGKELDVRRLEMDYSILVSEEELQDGKWFVLRVENSGNKSSKKGVVHLGVPEFLDVKFDTTFFIAPILRKDLYYRFGGTPVYEIPFDEILPGKGFIKPGDTIEKPMSKAVALIKLSMPDTLKGKDWRLCKHITWPLLYRITTEDEEGVYPIRRIMVYTAPQIKPGSFSFAQDVQYLEAVDSAFRENRKQNLYKKRFSVDFPDEVFSSYEIKFE